VVKQYQEFSAAGLRCGIGRILGEAKVYGEINEYKESEDHLSKSISVEMRARTVPFWINLCKATLARAKSVGKEKDVNLGSLIDSVSKNKMKVYDGLMRRLIGEILLNIGNEHMNHARDWIEKA
jgi:hypothetical protein